MEHPSRRPPAATPITAALPVAVAIGVFGVIYGAAAVPVLGGGLAWWSSVLIFSGAAQFTMLGLLAAGSPPAAVVVATAILALRHIPLAMVLRPRLPARPSRRAALSWFLIDETTGLALAAPGDASRTLALGGAMAYTAWVGGTAIGIAGGSAASLEPVADALFPVLFVGLAGMTAASNSTVVRAVLAAVLTLVLLLVWPAIGGIGAVGVAILVAMAGPR
ncbi:MAG: AzlC family ABC transporter permease [Nitriliruptoraceae bacterium]|nr:AzlC family ABC transporter permease [Nitriliruptoraceae bacterium]